MLGSLEGAILKNKARGKRGKSSQKRRFTLFLVSSHGDSRALSFDARTPKIILACIGLAIISLALLIRSYRLNVQELRELRYMRDLAESQRQLIVELEEQFSELSNRLEQAESLGSEIRELLEVEGVVPQVFAPSLGLGAPLRVLRTVSRSQSSIRRELSPDEMGRVLYILKESADKLAYETEDILEETRYLYEMANELVARLRATPSIWPVKGDVTSEYGWRTHPLNRTKEHHDGVDIGADWGAPIVATADGRVTFAGYRYGYGWTVVVEHGYGIETLYAHCSRLAVSVGQEVKRGDLVAYVGQSGTATGPHVHYEVRLWGRTTDPSEYLPDETWEVDLSVCQDREHNQAGDF